MPPPAGRADNASRLEGIEGSAGGLAVDAQALRSQFGIQHRHRREHRQQTRRRSVFAESACCLPPRGDRLHATCRCGRRLGRVLAGSAEGSQPRAQSRRAGQGIVSVAFDGLRGVERVVVDAPVVAQRGADRHGTTRRVRCIIWAYGLLMCPAEVTWPVRWAHVLSERGTGGAPGRNRTCAHGLGDRCSIH